jgi:hypothetical protein
MCLALFVFASGQANADPLSKAAQKCVNSINKGAAKVGKAQDGDNTACVKNAGKSKLTGTAEDCITSDPKGKVAKAISKIKTGDCADPPPFPQVDTDGASIGSSMVQAELALIHDVFGSDLDATLVVSSKLVEGSKDDAKCQASVAKQVGKCATARYASYNACKKDGMKDGTIDAVVGMAALEACLAADPKGKITKDCGTKMDKALEKCAGRDTDALLPGCAGQGDVAECLADLVTVRTDAALSAVDGLDLPVVIGAHLAVEDPHAICVGGTNDGGVCSASLIAPYGNECPAGHCIAQAAHSAILNADAVDIPFLLDGATSLDCGAVDPNTGIAPCQCQIESLLGQDISVIGWICLDPVPGLCGPGQVDCDGGSPMDQDLKMHHDAGQIAWEQDPISFPSKYCDDTPSQANAVCEEMCDFYCGTLGPAYEIYESSCEGFCQSGPDGVSCSLHEDCPNEDCAGGSLSAPHAGLCQCSCIAQGIGDPSRPGAIQCAVGLHTTIEAAGPCDGVDRTISITPVCLPVTSETASASFVLANPSTPGSFDGITLLGDPGGGCDALITSVTAGSSLVGHSSNFDSAIGDVITRNINVYK